eukprot:scpid67230/ scgid5603/ Spermatogenesis-associated protein 22
MYSSKKDSHQQVLSNVFGQRKRPRQPLMTQPTSFKPPLMGEGDARIGHGGSQSPAMKSTGSPGFLPQPKPGPTNIARTQTSAWSQSNRQNQGSRSLAQPHGVSGTPTLKREARVIGAGDAHERVSYQQNFAIAPNRQQQQHQGHQSFLVSSHQVNTPPDLAMSTQNHTKQSGTKLNQGSSENKWKSSRSHKAGLPRYMSGNIQSVQDWSKHKDTIPFVAEVYGQLNSQVSTNAATGGQEFFLKDSSGAMKCCFWPMDRGLPRMCRLQNYRCVGTYHEPLNLFRCASVRPLKANEEALIVENMQKSEHVFKEMLMCQHEA